MCMQKVSPVGYIIEMTVKDHNLLNGEMTPPNSPVNERNEQESAFQKGPSAKERPSIINKGRGLH